MKIAVSPTRISLTSMFNALVYLAELQIIQGAIAIVGSEFSTRHKLHDF
jgi:hypothetical protein